MSALLINPALHCMDFPNYYNNKNIKGSTKIYSNFQTTHSIYDLNIRAIFCKSNEKTFNNFCKKVYQNVSSNLFEPIPNKNEPDSNRENKIKQEILNVMNKQDINGIVALTKITCDQKKIKTLVVSSNSNYKAFRIVNKTTYECDYNEFIPIKQTFLPILVKKIKIGIFISTDNKSGPIILATNNISKLSLEKAIQDNDINFYKATYLPMSQIQINSDTEKIEKYIEDISLAYKNGVKEYKKNIINKIFSVSEKNNNSQEKNKAVFLIFSQLLFIDQVLTFILNFKFKK